MNVLIVKMHYIKTENQDFVYYLILQKFPFHRNVKTISFALVFESFRNTVIIIIALDFLRNLFIR